MSKHIDLINAWKNGAIIQFYNKTSRKFVDVDDNQPCWADENIYRVKITDAERIQELEDMLDVATRNAEDGLKQVKANDIVIENLKLSIDASNRSMATLTNERQELRREVSYQSGLREELQLAHTTLLEDFGALKRYKDIQASNFNSLHAENKTLKENQEYNERVIERKSKEYVELYTLHQREIDNHANTRKHLDVANREANQQAFKVRKLCEELESLHRQLNFTKELNANQESTIISLQDKVKLCQECNGNQYAIIQDLQSKIDGSEVSQGDRILAILEANRDYLQTALLSLPKYSEDGDAWYGASISTPKDFLEFDINVWEDDESGVIKVSAYLVEDDHTNTACGINLEATFSESCMNCPLAKPSQK
ncbi:hypothetical protein [Methylotenera sp.]|uniref:hypothetical protein n=1 Tax=Methylotenera sp. TaxID=2051956 RepID=UPI002489B1B1|nr:hypothetical protein [Methylotenera sp.]MDI1362555.1 hypothetical protein [Methylotenera sp.]